MNKDLYSSGYDQGRFDVLFDLWNFLYGNYAREIFTGERRDVVDPDNAKEFERMRLRRGALRGMKMTPEEEDDDMLYSTLELEIMEAIARSTTFTLPEVRQSYEQLKMVRDHPLSAFVEALEELEEDDMMSGGPALMEKVCGTEKKDEDVKGETSGLEKD